MFWVMGAVGVVAAIFFARLIHSPTKHPWINKAEFDHIEAGGGLVRMEEASASNGAAFTLGQRQAGAVRAACCWASIWASTASTS
ncbi:hypothetical protein ACRAWD_18600 [Caulobacter segnis]